MVFKADWEKTDQNHTISKVTIEKMVHSVLPNKKLVYQQVIAGGCANINVKIRFAGDDTLFILRIYLRDKEAVYREKEISKLLKKEIPVPEIYYIGDYEGYRFAIAEFMKGSTLRDLLLSDKDHDVETIMCDLGSLLAQITKYTFSKSGFFDKNLCVIQENSKESYLSFAKNSLKNQIVQTQLNSHKIEKINYYLDKYAHLFPDAKDRYLVHGDFDPANILVDKVSHSWKITGVLDWEFSFSGSFLCDLANMLRYAHKMPSIYEKSFLQGLENSSIILPEQWKLSVHLLNILSLLDCLQRGDPINRPKQCSDICDLLSYIITQLESKL